MLTGNKQPGMFSEADISRFRSRFIRAGDDECWPWTYHANHAGHGRMWAAGRNTLAAHIALELDGRPRPTGGCALHSCYNSPCVNPKHLRWGTQLENIRDREDRRRGGSAQGRLNGSARLNEEAVRAIRNDQRLVSEIAREHGVTVQAIHAVKKGRTWKHVDQLDAPQGGQADMPSVQSHEEEEARALPFGDGR